MLTESSPGKSARVGVIGSYAKALVMTTDRIPVSGETLIGRDYRGTFGGKGSDMAIQAARLGATVSFIGVVGSDEFGHELVALLDAEGIDRMALRLTNERPTGVGFIVKDSAGANVIVVDMGANELFTTEDIEAGRLSIESCEVVLAQLEIPLSTALYGLALARSAGAKTILNPAPAADLRGQDLSCVDVITPNQTEARLLLGLEPDCAIDDRQLAQELFGLGVGAVVVTRGGEGARIFELDAAARSVVHETVIPAYDVSLVDSNGAGDSFNAGLAVALGEGRSLIAAARFAAAVGGLCCEHWETVPSYQRRDVVDAFIARQNERGTVE